jgi:5-methylcytosine-specific restriction enzyme A
MQYCAAPGCGTLVARGRCPVHAVQLEHTRPNRLARRWYCTARWSYLRAQVLVAAAYQCAQCGQVQQRLEVDHITKHDGNPQRFWDRANLQALCPTCHHAKTKRGA